MLAEGGARFGTDVLKLLALGVRAVGLGRPFYFANQYSADGVTRAADLLKYEVRKVGDVGQETHVWLRRLTNLLCVF